MTEPSIRSVSEQIRDRVSANVAALKNKAHYPFPASIPNPPALLIFGSTATISHGSTQMWDLAITGHLLVPLIGNIGKEQITGEDLVMLVVDTFDAQAHKQNYILDGQASRCAVTDIQFNQSLSFAGHSYLGHVLTFGIKMHRRAETP